MLPLDEALWQHLPDAYGAVDVAERLSALFTAWDPKEADDLFYSCLCHQETTYPATLAAVPHLLAYAEQASDPEIRSATTDFLGLVLQCDQYDLAEDGSHAGLWLDASDLEPGVVAHLTSGYSACRPGIMALLAESMRLPGASPMIASYYAAGLRLFPVADMIAWMDSSCGCACPNCSTEFEVLLSGNTLAGFQLDSHGDRVMRPSAQRRTDGSDAVPEASFVVQPFTGDQAPSAAAQELLDMAAPSPEATKVVRHALGSFVCSACGTTGPLVPAEPT